MNTFYINTNSSRFTMIGGTEQEDPQVRLNQHNAKGNLDKWIKGEKAKWIDVPDYRKVEQYFEDHYGSLQVPGQSREIYDMTEEQAIYVRDKALGRSIGYVSPFAIEQAERVERMDRNHPEIEIKKNDEIKPSSDSGKFQVRFEGLDIPNANLLKERVEVDGEIREPLVIWVNEGITWVISGNHRLYVARELGMDIPTYRLPEHIDIECMREIANLLNNHDPKISIKPRDIRERLIQDMNDPQLGVQKVEDNIDYYCQLFKRTKSGMGLFIRGARLKREERIKAETLFFVYDENTLSEAKSLSTSEVYVSLVNCKDIYGVMGKDFMHALKDSYSQVHFVLYSSSATDFDQRDSRSKSFNTYVELLRENTNLEYSSEIINQRGQQFMRGE